MRFNKRKCFSVELDFSVGDVTSIKKETGKFVYYKIFPEECIDWELKRARRFFRLETRKDDKKYFKELFNEYRKRKYVSR